MIKVFEIDRGQRDHSTSWGSLGYLYTIVALRIYISVGKAGSAVLPLSVILRVFSPKYNICASHADLIGGRSKIPPTI